MTKNEAAKLMAVLAAAYAHNLTTDELQVWFGSALETCDPMIGGMAAQRIIQVDQFWPTPARFLEVKRSLEHPDPVKALPEGPRTAEERENVRQLVTKIRETINAQSGRRHWHGGPNPCEVCGGMTSDRKVLAKYAPTIESESA